MILVGKQGFLHHADRIPEGHKAVGIDDPDGVGLLDPQKIIRFDIGHDIAVFVQDPHCLREGDRDGDRLLQRAGGMEIEVAAPVGVADDIDGVPPVADKEGADGNLHGIGASQFLLVLQTLQKLLFVFIKRNVCLPAFFQNQGTIGKADQSARITAGGGIVFFYDHMHAGHDPGSGHNMSSVDQTCAAGGILVFFSVSRDQDICSRDRENGTLRHGNTLSCLFAFIYQNSLRHRKHLLFSLMQVIDLCLLLQCGCRRCLSLSCRS